MGVLWLSRIGAEMEPSLSTKLLSLAYINQASSKEYRLLSCREGKFLPDNSAGGIVYSQLLKLYLV